MRYAFSAQLFAPKSSLVGRFNIVAQITHRAIFDLLPARIDGLRMPAHRQKKSRRLNESKNALLKLEPNCALATRFPIQGTRGASRSVDRLLVPSRRWCRRRACNRASARSHRRHHETPFHTQAYVQNSYARKLTAQAGMVASRLIQS